MDTLREKKEKMWETTTVIKMFIYLKNSFLLKTQPKDLA
jgi:hypothetical protein